MLQVYHLLCNFIVIFLLLAISNFPFSVAKGLTVVYLALLCPLVLVVCLYIGFCQRYVGLFEQEM